MIQNAFPRRHYLPYRFSLVVFFSELSKFKWLGINFFQAADGRKGRTRLSVTHWYGSEKLTGASLLSHCMRTVESWPE